MNALCYQQQRLSDTIAAEFINKMYDNLDYPEFYWIGWDPIGTIWYADDFWSMTDMYEVLLKEYDKKDVWNWYYYTLDYCGDQREAYLSLTAFCGHYKCYTWELSDIYKLEIEKRNKNTAYWNSEEWKAETDRICKESIDKFINGY